ncbi:MAG: hypothetical protein LBC12_01445 [Nitrososphaerota archaeon]|nr:hypothetical protein [Nitrososphaerota archaeon]
MRAFYQGVLDGVDVRTRDGRVFYWKCSWVVEYLFGAVRGVGGLSSFCVGVW